MSSRDMARFRQGLTFDDVLLVPAHSEVLPSEVALGTRLSRCNFTTHQCGHIECINDGDCTPPKTCRDNFTCT